MAVKTKEADRGDLWDRLGNRSVAGEPETRGKCGKTLRRNGRAHKWGCHSNTPCPQQVPIDRVQPKLLRDDARIRSHFGAVVGQLGARKEFFFL